MKTPKPISRLINHFERLPGIGPKTAQRLVFYLLHFPQEEIEKFAEDLIKFKTETLLCDICKNVDDTNPCSICTNPSRDTSVIAVVQTPLDVYALERAGFKGKYHVLHGLIDPLSNIGPDEIYIKELIQRIKTYMESPREDFEQILNSLGHVTDVDEEVQDAPALEIIMATNSSMEGESTSMFITKKIKELGFDDSQIKLTRIARGLPVGGDIEYADAITLLRSLEGRSTY